MIGRVSHHSPIYHSTPSTRIDVPSRGLIRNQNNSINKTNNNNTNSNNYESGLLVPLSSRSILTQSPLWYSNNYNFSRGLKQKSVLSKNYPKANEQKKNKTSQQTTPEAIPNDGDESGEPLDELLSQGPEGEEEEEEVVADKVTFSNRPLVAIVGRPNVGKSTLFNALIERKQRKALVTPSKSSNYLYLSIL